jgi:hypothetical protein
MLFGEVGVNLGNVNDEVDTMKLWWRILSKLKWDQKWNGYRFVSLEEYKEREEMLNEMVKIMPRKIIPIGPVDEEEEGIKNGQTPEEACKARIWRRANKNPGNMNDPEYKRLGEFFFGKVKDE